MLKEETNIEALERFLLDSQLLDNLDEKLNQFNVFETLGIVNAEIRHSNVLAWLLDPKETHGLDDLFLKNFLKNIFFSNKYSINTKQSLIDVSLMDFFSFEIKREWNNIDLLLKSDKHRLVVTIENKVDSKEGKGQLIKYLDIVKKEYENYDKLFIYLTPGGEIPSDEEHWVILDYEKIAKLIEKVMEFRSNSITPPVRSFIDQYLTILRRYIVGNSEIEKICQEIYNKHQKALNLIYEHKPDICLNISKYLEKSIRNKENKGLILDQSSKTAIRFTSKHVDNVVSKAGEGWVNSNRILLFEFSNRPGSLILRLIIGPGNNETRQALYKAASENTKLFSHAKRALSGKWHTIYTKDFIRYSKDNPYDEEEIISKVESEFADFIEKDLPEIESYFELSDTVSDTKSI